MNVSVINKGLLVLSSVLLFSTSAAFAQTSSNDILTIGDSITAGLARDISGPITCAALGGIVVASNNQRSCRGDGRQGVGGWQPSLRNLTGVNVFNYGSSGELTFEMEARLDDHLRQRDSQFVLIMGGTNDVIGRRSTSLIIGNLQRMINLVKAEGRTPIIGTIPPLLFGRFNDRNGRVIELNNAIKALPDVAVADHYAALLGNWPNNTSGDFIHLGPTGNGVVAQVWFEAIQRERAGGAVITPILPLLLGN